MQTIGAIYFMRGDASGLIKIGFTASGIEYRRKQIQRQVQEPVTFLTSMPGTTTVERALHARFGASRIRGEWFSLTPDLFRVMEINDLGDFLVAAFGHESFRGSPLHQMIANGAAS